MTNVQKTVVENRLSNGYTILGESNSLSTQGRVVIINKGKHTMAINCLGYDEHTTGRTWSLK